MKAFGRFFFFKYCLGGLFCVIIMEPPIATTGPKFFKRLNDTAPESLPGLYKHNLQSFALLSIFIFSLSNNKVMKLSAKRYLQCEGGVGRKGLFKFPLLKKKKSLE